MGGLPAISVSRHRGTRQCDGMRQRRNKGRHHGRGRGEPACEIVAPVGAGCTAAVCLEAQRSVDDSGDGPSTIVTPMTATAARTSRDGRHLRRCTSPCSRRRHRVSRMPYTSARTPLLGGEASAMLIEPCAVRASRQPLGTKFTAGSSTPRSTDDFDTPLEPPLARHASRRPRSGRVAPSRRATRGQPSPRAGGAGAVESLESQWSGVGRVGQARHRRERRAAAGAGLRGASGSPHGSPGAASGPSRVGRGSPRSRCSSASLLELENDFRLKQAVCCPGCRVCRTQGEVLVNCFFF